LPGVRRASLAMESTIAFGGWSGPGGIKVAGHDLIDDLADGGPYLYSGTAGFFETLGVEITRGRTFEPAEYADGAEAVGLISETFARTVWPNADPIGQCFQIHARLFGPRNRPPEPCRRIVGVFHDFARGGIADKGAIAVAIPRLPGQGRNVQAIVVRAAGDPHDLVPSIRQAIQSVSPDVRLVQITEMATRFDELLQPWRLGAIMFAAFGGIALLVAVVGLYSLLAFGVAQRTRELGIRAALGASRADLLWLVLQRATLFIGVGLAIGTLIARVAGRYLESLLFGIKAGDVWVYAAVVATLFIAGLLAAILPARRATLVSPTVALTTE